MSDLNENCSCRMPHTCGNVRRKWRVYMPLGSILAALSPFYLSIYNLFIRMWPQYNLRAFVFTLLCQVVVIVGGSDLRCCASNSCTCNVCRAFIIPKLFFFVCWLYTNTIGLILFQIAKQSFISLQTCHSNTSVLTPGEGRQILRQPCADL